MPPSFRAIAKREKATIVESFLLWRSSNKRAVGKIGIFWFPCYSDNGRI
jgi:hypothetical protein